ncbi:MAG: type I-G CRISPR-associated helicase/endonuclease Cas3g [Prosthecobacter sp.]
MSRFTDIFQELTGSPPFPWQEALYLEFIEGEIRSAADLPTGLGKTSVVPIWLIALLTHPDRVPRRLVYVVNRRTVVDQTTDEVTQIRKRLEANPELAAKLRALCAVPVDVPLALSTLRGQFADNREWSVDPARPAVIVATVPMAGSGLLFSRYTCGFKLRPHHAAFLGQDALLVHDEAHLEPAFQKLLETIVAEQKRCGDASPLRVMQLSATARGDDGAAKPFRLTPQDYGNEIVKKRLNAAKNLRLVQIADEKLVADKLAELAVARRDSGRAVLVFVRTVELAHKVEAALKACKPLVLTGTMRGRERDALVDEPGFRRFMPSKTVEDEEHSSTCYLIATSAGEVGVNISAQDMVCDLSTYESMAQRFGRVNRFGNDDSAVIEVVHTEKFKIDDEREVKRGLTLDLLRRLNGNASPKALSDLPAREREEAFSPPPKLRPATDILFDAWAMTTLPWAMRKMKQPVPGCPPIDPYLHGEEDDWQPPETLVAWRTEVALIDERLAAIYDPQELLNEFPLKPHEILRDRSSRIKERLAEIARRLGVEEAGNHRIWVIRQDGTVEIKWFMEVAGKDAEFQIEDCMLLLSPLVGGLSGSGLMDGKAEGSKSLDVFEVTEPGGRITRARIRAAGQSIPPDRADLRHLRVEMVIDLWAAKEEPSETDSPEERYWLWLELPKASASDSLRDHRNSVTLADHTRDVVSHAKNISEKLNLSESLRRCLVLAAEFHDLGKKRRVWQRAIGNNNENEWLAKAGPGLRPRQTGEPYRHEFGSLMDARLTEDFNKLSDEEKDIVLHLIAAHHGRGRPHFPADEAFDPESAHVDAFALASEVPLRFARLQRRFGRWGLAYIESVLRAADYAASAEIHPLPATAHV